MKLTFKNVGQGDSLLLEWKDQGKNKLGIIDCNRFLGSNPILNHLKGIPRCEIEFVILSHPHFDHFSGLAELFDWSLKEKVYIKYFLHTSWLDPNYILTALETASAKTEAARVFQYARRLRDEMGTKINFVDDNPDRIKYFNNGWGLIFLSPSSKEIDNYAKGIKTFSREEDFNNNPNGNWLSTIVKLYKDGTCVLLTSDTEKDSFTRLRTEKKVDERLVLIQVPHHGSKKNHNRIYWEQTSRNKGTPAVISTGENRYNHPSNTVVRGFRSLQFAVYRTDMELPHAEGDLELTYALDSVSELVSQSTLLGNDLEFNLEALADRSKKKSC